MAGKGFGVVAFWVFFTSASFLYGYIYGQESEQFVFEGDILIDRWEYRKIKGNNFIPKAQEEMHRKNRNKRAVTSVPDKIWPNATVPYVIGPNITEAVRHNILRAMGHWEKHTCIRFVKRNEQNDYILIGPGACGCCSFVGKRGGAQAVSLSLHCAAYGVVVHELGHVIGFWHEHSRPDRDMYIRILKQNVVQEKLENFDKKSASEINSLGMPYDYNSIMHYRKKTFSKNRKNTMEPKQKGVFIGQREKLSIGDIVQANLLYHCPKPSCDEELYQNEGYINSPNYPVSYYKDHDCTWIIHTFPGEMVELEILDIYTEGGKGCNYDFIEVREGIDRSGNLIGRLCGSGKAGSFKSASSMWVWFHSDRSVTHRGFRARYLKREEIGSGAIESGSGEMMSYSGVSSEPLLWETPTLYTAACNKFMTAEKGYIDTPLLPVGYTGPPVECSWTIQGGLNASHIYLNVNGKDQSAHQKSQHCMGAIYQRKPKLLKKDYYNKQNEITPKKQRYGEFKIDRYTPVEYNCTEPLELMLSTRAVTIHWDSEENKQLHLQFVIGRLQ